MKFLCPKCKKRKVSLVDKLCRSCKQKLTPVALLKRTGKRIADGPLIRCPHSDCGGAYPLGYKPCPFCGRSNMSVGVTIVAIIAPVSNRWQEFKKNATPETKLRLQRAYFLISLAIFAAIFRTATHDSQWWKSALVSIVYLSFIGLILHWFAPRKIFAIVFQNTSGVMKTAFVFNYLALLLGLQRFIRNNWEHALTLAILIAVTWIAGYVLCAIFLPVSESIKKVFSEPPPTPFDPSGPQGRTAWRD